VVGDAALGHLQPYAIFIFQDIRPKLPIELDESEQGLDGARAESFICASILPLMAPALSPSALCAVCCWLERHIGTSSICCRISGA